MNVDVTKARSIFVEAVENHAADQWDNFLDDACGEDLALRRRVELLLKAHQGEDSFLDRGDEERGEERRDASPTIDQPITEKPGTQIGPYKLLQEIGEGGMGVVYMAEQTEPVKRRVALKLIKPGMDSRQVIARFEAERQALAIMDHPNMARVLDCGTTSAGHPYFVMELVKGVPITRYCDDNHLTPRQRLELFVPICQAIQHAHQKGIIHRDIKPSNILVAEYDQKPVPKIIDFGVAKALNQQLTEKTNFTVLGQVVGTIEYMSPEQARVNQLDVDTRSDIYSLGVLLYELLTGVTPFDRKRLLAAALDELLRIIREEEPPRPSTRLSTIDTLPSVAANRHTEPKKLSALMRGELDWIVMKALEKDRSRRYETASSFAVDVAHYLNDEPVLACPPSVRYRFGKFARRNKGRLVTASLLAAALLVTVGGVGWAVRDRSARQARVTTQVELILSDTDRLMQEQQWDEALVTVQRAEVAIAGGEARDDLQARVRNVMTDLEMVAQLEEIRLLRSQITNQGFDHEGADRQYAVAMREYGVDVNVLPTDEATDALRSRAAVLPALIAALDDWAFSRGKINDEAGAQALTNLVQTLDTDDWRRRVREALAANNEQLLEELADSAEVARQAPSTVALLAVALEKCDRRDAALELLGSALQEHPDDFWFHFISGNVTGSSRQPDYEQATRHYTAALALRPRNAIVLICLGTALDNHGKPEEAMYCLRRAIKIDPNLAFAHSLLGLALNKRRKLDEAIAKYRTAIELDPKESIPHKGLGVALREKGQLDKAIAEFRTAIELDPKYAGAHNDLGNALSDQGKQDEAIAEYRKAIELDPRIAGAHSNLANLLCEQGQLDDAIDEYRLAIELDLTFVDAHLNLGFVLERQGKLNEAIDCYRKCIELDPKLAMAHFNLGNALSKQGKLEEAIVEYRKAIELDPKYAGAHTNLGEALKQMGKLDHAITEFRTAVELDPKIAPAHYNLGNALYEQGELDEAIEEFRTAIELDPIDAKAHFNLGSALRANGCALDEAIAEYRTAIELDPNDVKAHGNLGVLLQRQGKLDEAINEYHTVIELNPKHALAHSNLGHALKDQGKLDEAIAEYRTAIKLDPKDAAAHNDLGTALAAQEKLDEAIDCWAKAIELQPENAMYHFNLGSALDIKGELERAIDYFQRAIELDAKYADPHNNLGIVLGKKGEMDEAIDCFRKAIKLDPKKAAAHNNLGKALAAQEKLNEAIDCWRKAVELEPNNANRYAKLVLYLTTAEDPALRNPSEAVTLARKAAGLQPQDANHWCNLGVAEYRAGNWQDSVDAFRQADVLIGGRGDRQHRFFLAMAHWRLGNQAQAHEAFEQAIAWLSENNINDGEQIRFRDEAESLLSNSPTAEKDKSDD